MKIAKKFAFILLLTFLTLSEGRKREKRTVGTILQYFGFKLVPLTESDRKGPPAEKYVYPEHTPRNPKFMRIQTMMPLIEVFDDASVENETTSTTTTKKPTAKIEVITTNETTATSTTPQKNTPLMIILPDSMMLASTEILSSTTPETSTTQASIEKSETEIIPQDSSTELSNNIQLLPLQSPPVPLSARITPMNRNFEFFRSNDVTSAFFGDQNFGFFPNILMKPRAFEVPSNINRLSSSSTSMNMNGQQFNYLTYHN
jgi:hypothetical protein